MIGPARGLAPALCASCLVACSGSSAKKHAQSNSDAGDAAPPMSVADTGLAIDASPRGDSGPVVPDASVPPRDGASDVSAVDAGRALDGASDGAIDDGGGGDAADAAADVASKELCGDLQDNDGDNDVDCNDSDCAADPSCVLGCQPPPPYTPLDPTAAGVAATGLVLWVRADVGVGTDENARACVWEDQSGLEHHLTQSVVATRPLSGATLGGRAALDFATGQNLQRGGVLGIGSASGRTFIAVLQLESLTVRAHTVMQGQGGTAGTYIGIDLNTFNTVGQRFGCYVTNNAYDADQATDLLPHVHSMWLDRMTPGLAVLANTHYAVDGTERTLTRTPAGLGNTLIEDFSGANFTLVGNSDIKIAEVLAYDRPLGSSELTAVEGYLAARYGL